MEGLGGEQDQGTQYEIPKESIKSCVKKRNQQWDSVFDFQMSGFNIDCVRLKFAFIKIMTSLGKLFINVVVPVQTVTLSQ